MPAVRPHFGRIIVQASEYNEAEDRYGLSLRLTDQSNRRIAPEGLGDTFRLSLERGQFKAQPLPSPGKVNFPRGWRELSAEAVVPLLARLAKQPSLFFSSVKEMDIEGTYKVLNRFYRAIQPVLTDEFLGKYRRATAKVLADLRRQYGSAAN